MNNDATPSPPSRQDRLSAWLYENELTLPKIGEALEIKHPASVHRLLAAEHIRPERHAALLKMGIPEELLPESKYVRSGPKPRLLKEATAAHPHA